MSTQVHHLAGCTPTPLAHYLKGLGVLRLVAGQKDEGARGWWAGESFHLATALDREALLRFLLDEYAPTPLVAPWNGGSGFFPKDNSAALTAIAGSRAPRFAVYRQAIDAGSNAVRALKAKPKKERKTELLQAFRRTWRGPALEWLDAVVVLDAEGNPAYPALLGTGGNDGRLDFTNNFMQRLVDLLDADHPLAPARPASAPLLESALFGAPAAGLRHAAVGQFLPGSAGGANGSTGFTGSAPLNAWDYVLMLEGALLFAAGLARQARAHALPQAAAPFAVRASPAGSGTTAPSDKNRGEHWMPLWERPAALGELRAVFSEGRVQVGQRTSTQPLDFGRSIARLGVARGIGAFERFGFIERNGLANLAVPLGRWRVKEQPHQKLLDEVAGWIGRLARAASAREAPAAVGRAARVCEEAMLACCQQGSDASRWQALLVALGGAEAQLPRSPRFSAERRLQPLPPLSPSWLSAADDGTPALRLALAFAAQHGPGPKGSVDWRDSVRRHFLPLDRTARRFEVRDDSLTHPADLVCVGALLPTVAIALLRRRAVEAGQQAFDYLPLLPVRYTEARLDDISAYLEGRVDGDAVLALARPLMALDWKRLKKPPLGPRLAPREIGSLGLYGLFRLALAPQPIPVPGRNGATPVGLDPAVLARLSAGDLQGAADVAVRRLCAVGLRPYLRTVVGSDQLRERLVTALTFPIRWKDTARLAQRLTHPQVSDEPDPRSSTTATEQEIITS